MSERDDLRKAEELARRLQRGVVEAGTTRVLKLLEQTRKKIIADVADSEWDRFILPRLLANVTRAWDDWRNRALDVIQEGQAAAWTLGSAITPVAGALALEVALPELPHSLLEALQQRLAGRIGGLTTSAKAAIDRTIATTLLSGGSREEAIAAIGRSVSRGAIGPAAGRFRSIAARAAFIHHHEAGSVYATARAKRQAQVMGYVPELRRVWVHRGHPLVPRPDHVAMHGQERGPEEDFENPVTGASLAHPRDPGADISETANCTCEVVLWRDLYGDKVAYIGEVTGEAAAAA